MKRRRYSMTKEDGEFVVLALQHLIFQFTEHNKTHGESAYNNYMISRAELLKERLEEYEWEVQA